MNPESKQNNIGHGGATYKLVGRVNFTLVVIGTTHIRRIVNVIVATRTIGCSLNTTEAIGWSLAQHRNDGSRKDVSPTLSIEIEKTETMAVVVRKSNLNNGNRKTGQRLVGIKSLMSESLWCYKVADVSRWSLTNQ